MRDQRMLRCLETLPRRTKVVLRNSLTRRYPAVPLPSTVTNTRSTEKGDEKDSKNSDLLNDCDIDVGDNLTYMGKFLLRIHHSVGNVLDSHMLETTPFYLSVLSFC